MCELVEIKTKPMDELSAIFPDGVVEKLTATQDVMGCNGESLYTASFLTQEASEELAKPYLLKLREETDNCPACILATLRQLNIHPRSIGYDYTEEVKKFWLDYNEEYREQEIEPW
jgi:hypothetical protein